MASARKVQVDVETNVVPASLQKIVTSLQGFAQKTNKELQRLFDFGSVFSDLAKKFTSLFQFRAIDSIISKLKSNMNSLFDSITKGFSGAIKGLGDFKDWFEGKFKSIGKLIGKQLAVDIKQTTSQFFDWFKKNKTQINESLNAIAREIGHVLSSFAKGLIQVVNLGKKFIEWFDSLPNGIKATSAAVVALWAVIKTGPVGMLTAIVTLAGDLVKDYNNYKYNKENGFVKGQHEQYVDVAFKGIWQTIDSDGTVSQKAFTIGQKLYTGIVNGLTGWLNANGDDIIDVATQIVEWIKKKIKEAGSTIAGLGENSQQGEALKTGILGFLGNIITFAFTATNQIASTLFDSFLQAINGMTQDEYKDKFTQNGQAAMGAVITGFILALSGASPTVSIIGAIASFLINAPKDENGQTIGWDSESLKAQVQAFAARIFQAVINIIQAAGDISTLFIDLILAVLGAVFDGKDAFSEAVKENEAYKTYASQFISAIFGGITAYITSGGNIVMTLLGTFLGAFWKVIVDAFNNEQNPVVDGGKINLDNFFKNLGAGMGQNIQGLGDILLIILQMAVEAFKGIEGVADIIVGWILGLFNIDKTNGSYETLESGLKTTLTTILMSILTGNIFTGILATIGTTVISAFGTARQQIKYSQTDSLNKAGNLSYAGRAKDLKDYTSDDWLNVVGLTWDQIKKIGSDLWQTITMVWSAIQQVWQQQDIWGKITNWWLGEENEDGTRQQNGFRSKLQFVWDGIVSGIQWVFAGLWQIISPLWTNIVNEIAYVIMSNPTLSSIFSFFGIIKKGAIRDNGDGTFNFAKNGQQVTLNNSMKNMVEQYGQYLTVKDGKLAIDFNVNWGTAFTSGQQQDYNEQFQKFLLSGGVEADVVALMNILKQVVEHDTATDYNGWTYRYLAVPANNLVGYNGGPNAVKTPDSQRIYQNGDVLLSPQEMLQLAATQTQQGKTSFNDLFNWIVESGLMGQNFAGIKDGMLYFKNGTSQSQMQRYGELYTELVSAYSALGEEPYFTNIQADPSIIINQIQESLKGTTFTIDGLLNLHANNDASSGQNQNSSGNTEPRGSSSKPFYVKEALGGRVSSPQHSLIGQDGTQYVIPITKPARAASLIRQMISQMGGNARETLMDALGLSDGTTIGSAMLDGLSISGSGLNVVYNNNVTAPVTINVQGSTQQKSGVVNDMNSVHQRAILRTIRSVGC